MEVLEWNSDKNELFNLFDCEDGSLNFSNMFFGRGGVHNTILHQIIYYLVEIYVPEDSFYYHATSRIYFCNPLKKLLNCLSIRVGTCSTVTKFISRDMVINNGEPFTNITYGYLYGPAWGTL